MAPYKFLNLENAQCVVWTAEDHYTHTFSEEISNEVLEDSTSLL